MPAHFTSSLDTRKIIALSMDRNAELHPAVPSLLRLFANPEVTWGDLSSVICTIFCQSIGLFLSIGSTFPIRISRTVIFYLSL